MRDFLEMPQSQRKIETIQNATIEELLEARRRIILNLAAVSPAIAT